MEKKGVIAGFLLILLITGGIFSKKILTKVQNTDSSKSQATSSPQSLPLPSQDDSKPRIVSTKPDPLDENIVPAEGPIEITFNKSLQNVPEFKIRIEPKIDYKVELSSDRKTAKIIFNKPLNLGSGFTLDIYPDTKFDNVGEWRENKTFHFRTIKYTGV